MEKLGNRKKLAIVGQSFRLPGQAPGELWDALCEGKFLVSQVAAQRWATDRGFHPRKSEPGTSYTFAAGSIGEAEAFDAAFFGISPREAVQMDPQQRLLLELTWEALEHAGIKPSTWRGSRTGVYIGYSATDYAYCRIDDLASIDAYTMTGNSASIAANRISYQFDFKGPSLAVDTACSSSLYAFHLACQALRSGDCDHAVVGGISLHFHPMAFVGFSKASMLSPSGACRVFDATADGYVRSEGGGIFVLKHLHEAIAEGDRILATIIDSAVNCDGRTTSLTVPDIDAQANLLREVYERAEVSPRDIDYIEIHGTGTAVGDPIETHALGLALGQRRPSDAPLAIGSIKSNLGHLETASGVAGLVKAIGCLRQRVIPPTIGINEPNPAIRFDTWNLRPIRQLTPLDPAKPLIIGVNSFGFGGANAHVILQSAPSATTGTALPAPPAQTPPVFISARSQAALQSVAAQYAMRLAELDPESAYDLAWSCWRHRDFLDYRAIAFGADAATQAQALNDLASGKASPNVVSGVALKASSPLAFVYSGNGSQWVGMGQTLLAADPVFRRAVSEVDRLFAPLGGYSIAAELTRDASNARLELTEIAQPLLFAVQVGITEMLRATGLAAAAVIGHSVGEVAAAWAAGALTLEQAVRVIAVRSAQQGRTRGDWGMTALGLSAEETHQLLEQRQLLGRITLAGINAPGSVTIAGAKTDLDRLESTLGKNIFFRRLNLDYAFHSPAMDALESDTISALHDLCPAATNLPFISTVTGEELAGERLDGHYWWRNIREPVRFANAVETLLRRDIRVFLEIGPHSVLRGYLNEIIRANRADGRAIGTLLRHDDHPIRIEQASFQALIAGVPYASERYFPAPGRRVELPHYPWQRQAFRHPVSSEGYRLVQRGKVHPLLGYPLAETADHWENQIDSALYPLLADHVVGGAVVFPAAGFAEMALAASRLKHGTPTLLVEDLEIRAPLVLDEDRAKTVRFSIDPVDGGFSIRGRDRLSDDAWTVHVVGKLPLPALASRDLGPVSPPPRPADLTQREHYRLADQVGLAYGPAFQGVAEVWRGDQSIFARLATAAKASEESDYLLHPADLDACFQLLIDLLWEGGNVESPAFVPARIEQLMVFRAGIRAGFGECRLRRRNARSILADFSLFASDGNCIATLRGVRLRAVSLIKQANHRPHWLDFRAVPRLHPRSTQGLPLLPNPSALAELVQRRLHNPDRLRRQRPFHEEVEPLVDALWSAFADAALRPLASGERLPSSATLLKAGKIVADAEPLFLELAAILVEDGMLAVEADGWTWHPDAGLPEAAEIWASLLADYPEFSPPIIEMGRVGLHLADMLSGKIAGDKLAGLAMTGFSAILDDFAQALADLVQATSAALTEGENLRILEICPAGSEPIVAKALASLDRDRCDYSVVMLGAEEASRWRERFPQIAFHAADLDQPDLSETLSELGRFQIILLADGLSWAADIMTVLTNIRHLAMENATVAIAQEEPGRSARIASQLADRVEPAHPPRRQRLRSQRQWHNLLSEFGYRELTALGDRPDHDGGRYILIGRAGAEPALERPLAAQENRHWLVLHERDSLTASLGAKLAEQLTSFGDAATLDEARLAEDPRSESDLLSLLNSGREPNAPITGIIVIAGNPAGDSEPIAESSLERVTNRCLGLTRLLETNQRQTSPLPCWLITIRGGLHLLPESTQHRLNLAPRDAYATTLAGFTRALANEYPETTLSWIDLAATEQPERLVPALATELLHATPEDEVILTDHGRYCPRLRHATPRPIETQTGSNGDERCIRLDFPPGGSLKQLVWRRAELPSPSADEIELDVRAAGLNFRDIMYASGFLPDEAVENGFAGPTLGLELSGVVRAVGAEVSDFNIGDEVIAFASASLATRVVTKASCVIAKPPELSFDAAATIPTAFFTVYYALHSLARLKAGESILIHGAAGAVGIAAIQMARLVGAEVYATAGSDRKRDFLRLLGVDHVLDSRSLRFADDVRELTDGAGVDVVLNSLAGEAMRRSIALLKPFGRFLELGKRDFYENTRIGVHPFRHNISYFGIDADQILSHAPDLARGLFAEMMALFARGALTAMPFQTFAAKDIKDAFSFMQQAKQIGKIVVSFVEHPEVAEAPTASATRWVLRSDATYLVTGGLSGFGLKTAVWLADKGARHLLLVSRSGTAATNESADIRRLEERGVQVTTLACDIASRNQVETLLRTTAARLPPLRGIVHSAAIIEDGFARGLTAEQMQRVLAPKVLGAAHLDQLTRDLKLDFFVLHSSATTLFGNPGQSAYVAANSYLEASATARRAQGLPALCVKWGPIGDTGFLQRNPEVRETLLGHLGGRALDAAAALDTLEQLLAENRGDLAVMHLDWPALRRFLPSAAAPKFSEVARKHGETGTDSVNANQVRLWLSQLSDGELNALFSEMLKKEISQILRLPLENLDDQRSVHELGMDSLMGSELIAAVEALFGVRLPTMAISEGPSIHRIVDRIIRQLRIKHGLLDGAEDLDGADTTARELASRHTHAEDQDELRQLTLGSSSYASI